MNKRVRVAVYVFLGVFLISMGTLKFNPLKMLRLRPEIAVPEEKACFDQTLPGGIRVLFFSNPDGSLTWDGYGKEWVDTEFYLAPRIVDMHMRWADFYQQWGKSGIDRMPAGLENAAQKSELPLEAYQWFIAYGLTPDDLNTFISQNQLTTAQVCGQGVVLTRQP